MLPLLMWVPVATSFVLGLVFLLAGDGPPVLKAFGSLIFLVAVLLQFHSPYPVIGLLLQASLALTLAVWKKMATAA